MGELFDNSSRRHMLKTASAIASNVRLLCTLLRWRWGRVRFFFSGAIDADRTGDGLRRELCAELGLDFVSYRRVCLQEVARVLTALANPLAVVGIPCAELLDD